MWRLAFAACLAGCYSPTVPLGALCGPGEACPSEQTCRGGRCVDPDTLVDGDVDDIGDVGGIIDASTDGNASPDAQVMCPASYASVTGQASKYRTVMTAKAWLAAEQDCEDDGTNNTHLAVVDNAGEHMAVDALTGASIWFGLTDRKVESVVKWVTGSAPTYTNFGNVAGNTGGYDCSGIYQGKWEWGDCSTLIKFVCECDGQPADPASY